MRTTMSQPRLSKKTEIPEVCSPCKGENQVHQVFVWRRHAILGKNGPFFPRTNIIHSENMFGATPDNSWTPPFIGEMRNTDKQECCGWDGLESPNDPK